MSDTSHAVAHAGEQAFVCKNCGLKEAFPDMPIDLQKFAQIGTAFLRKHKNCKPGVLSGTTKIVSK